MSILRLKGFSLKADNNLILENVSLKLDSNDFVAITSDQQGGKSNLLNVIAGFSLSGANTFTGGLFYKDKALKSRFDQRFHKYNEIVFVSEHDQLISRMNLQDNILLPFSYHGELCNMEKLYELLHAFNLDQSILALMPEQVNDVTTRICLIIRSLLLNPSLLLIDEIEGGMNKEEHNNMIRIIDKHCKDIQCAVLSTTTRIESDLYTQTLKIENKSFIQIEN